MGNQTSPMSLVPGTQLGSVSPRFTNVDIPLAKFKSKSQWSPKVGDFIMWHGWLYGRWYGVINYVDLQSNLIYVIKDNLPCLVVQKDPSEYAKATLQLSLGKIQEAPTGEYHILQDGVWCI